MNKINPTQLIHSILADGINGSYIRTHLPDINIRKGSTRYQ
jgi:hypothetical protein